VKRWAVLLLLAGCPKHPEPSDKPHAPPAEAGSAAAIVLPPSPPLPDVPMGLPQPAPHDGITPDAVAFGALLFADPALSQDGKVTTPPSDMPSGRFGMCDDSFGISWILNCAKAG